jgi:hypothetical protein
MALLVSLCLPALVLSPAQAATPVDISVSASVSPDSVDITGMVRAEGHPVGSMSVSIYLDDGFDTIVMTSGDGSFIYSMALPEPGNHTVRAATVGNEQYESARDTDSFRIDQPSKAETTLTVTLDPPEAEPGDRIQITGQLEAAGAGVSGTLVSLETSFGEIVAMVPTGEQGQFTTLLTLPASTEFPPSFTVTVSYAGDNVYEGSTNQAAGAIVAPAPPPPPTAAETSASASSQPGASSSAGATGSVTSSRAPTTGTEQTVTGPAQGRPAMEYVSIAFFTVALIGVGALVILGLVSHDRKKLARDERRGFGTDFGQQAR